MISLWFLLHYSKIFGILYSGVYGYFKVVIEWINGKNRLQVITLNSWMNKRKELVLSFSRINFKHIYIEYNTEADGLSKKALKLHEGIIYHQSFKESKLVD